MTLEIDMNSFTCSKCQKLSNNILGGECIVEKDGAQLRVCTKCSEKLQNKGWKEISRAR
jgi:ribosome-binding protein aMBF1 (putative translation factor)